MEYRSDEQIDVQVRRIVYDAFMLKGQPPNFTEIVDALGISMSILKGAFQRLAEGHILVLQPESGEILMANPFSSVPTPFLVEAEDQVWWGNCIWDALGILAMIGKDGQVRSSCPDCGEGLNLRIRSGELENTPWLHTSQSRQTGGGTISCLPGGQCFSSGQKNTSAGGANNGASQEEESLPVVRSGGWRRSGTVTIKGSQIGGARRGMKPRRYFLV